MTLNEGDILMTGTPVPMSTLEEGDHLEATLTYNSKVLSRIDNIIQREKWNYLNLLKSYLNL